MIGGSGCWLEPSSRGSCRERSREQQRLLDVLGKTEELTRRKQKEWTGEVLQLRKGGAALKVVLTISCVPGRSRIPNRILRQLNTEPGISSAASPAHEIQA